MLIVVVMVTSDGRMAHQIHGRRVVMMVMVVRVGHRT